MRSLSEVSAPTASPEDVIQGSGEMADRIRGYDWGTTSLGPIASWSETLIAVVNLMLFSSFSFAIYWGPEQILLYNDVYRPFPGEKHPKSLGSKGFEVWAEAGRFSASRSVLPSRMVPRPASAQLTFPF